MPLRYPGGKTRASKYIIPFFPPIKKLISPFFGGGSIERQLLKSGVSVYGNDICEPLIAFWQEVKNDRNQLADNLYQYKPTTPEQFNYFQANIFHELNRFNRAAWFFVLNRSTFGGQTFVKWMIKGQPSFTENAINRIRKCDYLDNLKLYSENYTDFINRFDDDDFMYLDPPYWLFHPYLYGPRGTNQKNFNHHELNEILKSKTNWVLSYNDCDFIRDLYKDYEIVNIRFYYSMGHHKQKSAKQRGEILILNVNHRNGNYPLC